MKIFNSILTKLIFLVALSEFLFMLAYEYFPPLVTLVERRAIFGPIINVLVLGFLITLIYLWSLKKPLDELIKVMNAVEKRDFSMRANEKRKDEFGFIATYFNKMIDKLRNWGQNLEQEVQVRTEELSATNEELKATNEELATTNEELKQTNEELEATTEELRAANEEAEKAKEAAEKKATELERFNKLAVGRELMMKELKARISQLEQELKEKG